MWRVRREARGHWGPETSPMPGKKTRPRPPKAKEHEGKNGIFVAHLESALTVVWSI